MEGQDYMTRHRIVQQLADVPVLDVHTHLVGGKLGARGLHDILLYHMGVSDLYAAGCPTGRRAADEEGHARVREAIPFLEQVRNTHVSWGVRIILRDLYGWEEPVTEGNWRKLDDLIRERADDRAWHREILKKVDIRRIGTELERREEGADDDLLQYALEWAFFTRCQWGEFDTALYELERCWGKSPESPTPIGSGTRPSAARAIRTLDDVHAALRHYVDAIPYDRVLSTATHISSDLDLAPVTDDEMSRALSRRVQARERERDIYASYVNETYLSALEAKGKDLVYQFSYGAEPLPFETASRISSRSIRQVGEMIGRHPRLRFQCFLSSAHANQSLCTLARELPNLSLAGYWWHNFFPSVMRQVIEERLDMLPLNRQIGFFSDAYCVEWTYAKAHLVRRQLAAVLEGKIDQGQYTVRDALEIAQAILYESPQALLGMSPARAHAVQTKEVVS